MMWWPHMFDGFGWWMLFGGLWMLIFWGAIIFLIVWGIRKLTEHGPEHRISARQDPLEIARERYARGEITREQFEQIKSDLSA